MNPKVLMIGASILGALTGIFLISVRKPGYDFFIWLARFAAIGVGAGNLALIILYKLFEWLGQI